MNENSQPAFGKISLHGAGMGAPTPELVEKRAREIALIDERNPDEFTDADWEQARRELMGEKVPVEPEDLDERSATELADRDPVIGSRGERAPRAGLDDDETLGEHLVADGLEEAEHDRMVQARHEELSQEGGVIEDE